MSTAPLRGLPPASPPPPLRLLPNPRRARSRRMPFALVVLALIGGGLVGLLLLNTVLAQDAFVLNALQTRTATLTDREQELARTVAADEAPAALARRAAELGMVPGGDPLYLRLPDGRVLGKPKAAVGVTPPVSTPAPKPAPTMAPR